MAQLCRLEAELSENGVHLPNKNPALVYSLPMQVYELASKRCANYEDCINFFNPKRKRNLLQRFIRTV